jgi:hypothetical protein
MQMLKLSSFMAEMACLAPDGANSGLILHRKICVFRKFPSGFLSEFTHDRPRLADFQAKMLIVAKIWHVMCICEAGGTEPAKREKRRDIFS